VNGESSVHIDRGRWLYRFALNSNNIAIYRARRAGQDLAPLEVWRSLAQLGISDAFIVPVAGGWQPFVELTESRQRWTLAKRDTMAEAEAATRHFLGTLADAVCHASQLHAASNEKEPDVLPMRVPEPPAPPAEDGTVELVLSHARSAREASGWELVYSRQRLLR
jgi:hypothetical protein